MSWFLWSPLFLAFLWGSAAPQQSQYSPVKLAWKFKEKDRFTLESQVSQVELRRIEGQLHRDVLRVQIISSFTVSKVLEDKSVVLDQKIDDARYLFDGTDRVNAALQADLFAKLSGATFRITLTDEGKVRQFEGYEELVQRIAKNNPQDAERFKMMVKEEAMKTATEEGFGCFPKETVRPGEKWTRPLHIPVPPAGSLKGELTYKLLSVTKGKARITAKCESSEFQPGDTALAGVKCEFALDARDSTLLFDIDKGRLTSSETTTRYKGKVIGAPMEGAIPMTLLDVELQQTVRITVRDRSRN
jgi:hypothetical protein